MGPRSCSDFLAPPPCWVLVGLVERVAHHAVRWPPGGAHRCPLGPEPLRSLARARLVSARAGSRAGSTLDRRQLPGRFRLMQGPATPPWLPGEKYAWWVPSDLRRAPPQPGVRSEVGGQRSIYHGRVRQRSQPWYPPGGHSINPPGRRGHRCRARAVALLTDTPICRSFGVRSAALTSGSRGSGCSDHPVGSGGSWSEIPQEAVEPTRHHRLELEWRAIR